MGGGQDALVLCLKPSQTGHEGSIGEEGNALFYSYSIAKKDKNNI